MQIDRPVHLDWRQWLDLYRTAVEEYRFEVRLNADRTQHFLLLNGAISSAAIALLKLQVAPSAVAGIFVIGVMTAVLGLLVVTRGHSYYRATAYKKMLLEDLMGLHEPLDGYEGGAATLAISTTQSMRRAKSILAAPDSWISQTWLRPGTIVFWTGVVFVLFAALDLVGALAAVLT
jgi:hypothetical protein